MSFNYNLLFGDRYQRSVHIVDLSVVAVIVVVVVVLVITMMMIVVMIIVMIVMVFIMGQTLSHVTVVATELIVARITFRLL